MGNPKADMVDRILSICVVTDAVDCVGRHVEDWTSHPLSRRTRGFVITGQHSETPGTLTWSGWRAAMGS